MKVFLSWSGEPSKYIAEALKGWLVQVIQALEPWISTGIEKGKRWNADIAQKLEESKVGIFVLTKDNLNSTWLHFEAGAISKTTDAYVCTFLFNLKPSDIKPPLADFQATVFERDDVFKLLQTINKKLGESGAKPLDSDTLNGVFEIFYPQLEQRLKEAPEGKSTEQVRSDRELLEEILQNTRDLQPKRARPAIMQDNHIYHLQILTNNFIKKYQLEHGISDLELKDRLAEIMARMLPYLLESGFSQTDVTDAVLNYVDGRDLKARIKAAAKKRIFGWNRLEKTATPLAGASVSLVPI